MTLQPLQETRIRSGAQQFPVMLGMQMPTPGEYRYPAHWHTYLELIYIWQGEATFLVSGAPHELRQGDLLLIHPNEVHAVHIPRADDTRYSVISSAPELLYHAGSSLAESRYALPFLLAQPALQRQFAASELSGTSVPAWIGELIEEDRRRDFGYELAMRSSLTLLFLWMLRHWHKTGAIAADAEPNLRTQRSLRALFEHVEAHYDKPLSAEEAALMCGMSYSHFARVFRQATGGTFNAYLNSVRLQQSEKLLLASDQSITDIAMNTGFASSSYYIKQFRKYKGVAPSRFRQIAQQGTP